MKYNWLKWIGILVVVYAAAAGLTLALASCVLNPLEPIEPHYVSAERKTYTAIDGRARDYLKADESLSEEELQERWTQLDDWDVLILEGETQPDLVMKEAHLRRERELFDKITPWYLAYIADDDALDQGQKETAADTVIGWNLRLERAERAAGIRGPPKE